MHRSSTLLFPRWARSLERAHLFCLKFWAVCMGEGFGGRHGRRLALLCARRSLGDSPIIVQNREHDFSGLKSIILSGSQRGFIGKIRLGARRHGTKMGEFCPRERQADDLGESLPFARGASADVWPTN